MMELVVHVGLMNSVAGRWPEEVQENWDEKVRAIRERAEQEIVEIQEFAEFYDAD
jgi:hypothetical protein